MNKTNTILIILAASLTAGCVNFATPSPLVTLGGPSTVHRGESEVGVAVGGALVTEDIGHASGSGALVRYKYGVTEGFDVGLDGVYARYGDNDAVSIKAAARFQLAPNWRLEAGLGAADATLGKSTNADLGITWGTLRDRPWNYYTTLRAGAARGAEGRFLFHFDDDPDDGPSPDSTFGMLTFGMQSAVRDHRRFVWETGVGVVDPDGEDSAMMFYLAAGMLLNP